MQTKPLIIYHKDCLDGLGAAYAFWRYFKDDAIYLPAGYGEEIPLDLLNENRSVYIVDFSYPNEQLEKLCNFSRTVTIIDHHKTAIEALATYEHPRLEKRLDSTRSGAALAWCYVWPDLPVPDVILNIEDRDLWKWKLPDTRTVTMALMSFELTFDDLDNFANSKQAIDLLRVSGDALDRQQTKYIMQLAENRRKMMIGGYEVDVVNANYMFASDLGNLLAMETEYFAATYFDTPDKRVFSLRSNQQGTDVSEVAKVYGGGGHKHAAGFSVPRFNELAMK